jgi:YggT family protein
MNDVVGGLRVVSDVLRYALFGAAAVAGLVALVDWLVRTRRINPFSPIARFFRRTVDPLMVPVERRVIRAGGRPASAPIWALGAVVVGGLLLIALLDFLTRQLLFAGAAVSGGPRGVLGLLVGWTFAILRIALIVPPYSPWIRWSYGLTEWMLAPLRRVIPLLGSIDVTPIVAYLLLGFLDGIVVRAVVG